MCTYVNEVFTHINIRQPKTLLDIFQSLKIISAIHMYKLI